MNRLLRAIRRLPLLREPAASGTGTWSETVLKKVLTPRHAALRAQHPDERAQRELRFLERSASYRAARADGPALGQFPTDEVTIHGLKFLVPADARKAAGIADRLLQRRELPLEEILRARELAVGTAMIDLGANIGTTSIPRVVLGDFQYVWAAEPAPANYHALVANVVSNGLQGLVLPDQAAIGSTTGPVTMKLSQQLGGHRVRAASRAPAKEQDERFVEVPGMTLDGWVAHLGIDLNRVSFIKCDTQGWEGHILRGAGQVLRCKHIAWQLEFWPKGLTASGVPLEEVVERLTSSFSHFLNLWDGPGAQRLQTTDRLPSALKTQIRGGREGGYLDLIAFNA